MDKFNVQNYLEMSEKGSFISPADYQYNESVRRTKRNYKTKIHVLEKPSRYVNFHLEGASPVAKKSSRMITIARPQTEPNLLGSNIHYYNRAEKYGREIYEVPMSSREVDNRSSHIDLSKLYQTSSKPHPPLTEREVKYIQKKDGHDEVMSTHINKMKDGIQRLQEVTQKFNCTENYKEDIDFLIKNVKKAIRNAECRENSRLR